jgi:hypothetical protein
MPLNKNYPAKNIIIEAGHSIISGYAPESFLNVERDEDEFFFSNGVRTKNNNRSGVITFSLLESSPSNKILINYLKADQEFNKGIFPMIIKDQANNVLHKVDMAWVRDSHAYPELGIKSGERTWVLEATSIESF